MKEYFGNELFALMQKYNVKSISGEILESNSEEIEDVKNLSDHSIINVKFEVGEDYNSDLFLDATDEKFKEINCNFSFNTVIGNDYPVKPETT